MALVARDILLLALLLPAAVAFPEGLAARTDDSGAAAAAALLSTDPAATGSIPPTADVPSVTLGKSGLPVPRFVSLKSNKVNVRVGPGEGYAIAWTFTRAALPVACKRRSENFLRKSAME